MTLPADPDLNVTEQKTKKKVSQKSLTGYAQKIYIDTDTGEEVHIGINKKRIHTGKHFYKCYLADFFKSLKFIKSRQLEIVSYIITRINSSTNYYIGTYDDIVEGTGAARQTVASTMRELQDGNFLRLKQNGVYMFNPQIIFKGDTARQEKLVQEYERLAATTNNDKD